MRAQIIVTDILTVIDKHPTAELGVGQIMEEIRHTHGIGSTPSLTQMQAALVLLLSTREIVARGPSHDAYSMYYRRPQ